MANELMTTEEVLSRLGDYKEKAQEEYGLTSLGIFGSFVSGKQDGNSDVDIVFETNAPNLFRTSQMKCDLEKLLGRPVDVVRLRKHMNPRLRRRILQEARYV